MHTDDNPMITNTSGLIRQGWESFERVMVPSGAGEVQRNVCRRVFYAGVALTLAVIDRLERPDVSRDDAVVTLRMLAEECDAFMRNK